uniref:Uncharacterized protein n=1 Tax=Opuntia streptacantha TaxID=393608 RepID=A0A7C9CYQ6_OPUST
MCKYMLVTWKDMLDVEHKCTLNAFWCKHGVCCIVSIGRYQSWLKWYANTFVCGAVVVYLWQLGQVMCDMYVCNLAMLKKEGKCCPNLSRLRDRNLDVGLNLRPKQNFGRKGVPWSRSVPV